jgi:hypothetical protein
VPGCNDPVTASQQVEPRSLGRQSFAAMQKQQRPALAAFDHLEGDAGDRQHLDHPGIIAETLREFQEGLAEIRRSR